MGKKLFAVYLGGRADRCNIELHDVDDLLELGQVDEYSISLTPEKSTHTPQPVSAYIKLDFATVL